MDRGTRLVLGYGAIPEDVPVAHWVEARPGAWGRSQVWVAELVDGRWAVRWSPWRAPNAARAYGTRAAAEQVARQLMERHGGQWELITGRPPGQGPACSPMREAAPASDRGGGWLRSARMGQMPADIGELELRLLRPRGSEHAILSSFPTVAGAPLRHRSGCCAPD